MKKEKLFILTLFLLASSLGAATPINKSQQQNQKPTVQKQDDDDDEPKSEAEKVGRKEAEQKACGLKEIDYSVRTDKSQHPTPEPPADKAIVYVIRPTLIGQKIQTKLAVDGEWKGANRGNNYFFFTLEPGEHHFCADAENRSLLSLKVEAGKTYYLQQKIKAGFIKARTKLVQLDDEEGKKGLAKCHLSIAEEKK